MEGQQVPEVAPRAVLTADHPAVAEVLRGTVVERAPAASVAVLPAAAGAEGRREDKAVAAAGREDELAVAALPA